MTSILIFGFIVLLYYHVIQYLLGEYDGIIMELKMKIKKLKTQKIAEWAACDKHPKYAGKGKPTSNCQKCHFIYTWVQGR